VALDDPRDGASDPLSDLKDALAASGPKPPPESMEAFFARQGAPETKGVYLDYAETLAILRAGGMPAASTGIPDELTYDQAKQLEAVVEASTAMAKAIFCTSAPPDQIEALPEFAAWKAAAPTDPAVRRNFLLSLPAHAVEALARGPGPAAASTTHNQELPHGR